MNFKRSCVILFCAFVMTAPRAFAASVEFEEDFALPVVYVNLVVDAGSVNDPQSRLGLANVTGQMLLRGTWQHDKIAFARAISELGGQIEVSVLPDATIIRCAVLAENLDPFLALVAEAVTSPRFALNELNRLKGELEGELLAMKGDDQELAAYHFLRFFYGKHPYGNPAEGTQKGVANVYFKQVQDFYGEHFGPLSVHLIGAGATKRATVQNWFDTVTEKLAKANPKAVAAPALADPELPSGRRALIIDKKNATQSQVYIGGRGLRPTDEGFYAASLANHSFGEGGFESTLMKEIRVKRGWSYGARNAFRFGKYRKHFSMHVFPKTKDTAPATALVLELFESWVKHGITPEQFAFSQASVVNNAPFNYDTSKKRLDNRTTEFINRFPEDFMKNYAKNIEKVREQDVLPALSKLLNDKNLTLTIVGDAAKLKDAISHLPGFAPPIVKSYLED